MQPSGRAVGEPHDAVVEQRVEPRGAELVLDGRAAAAAVGALREYPHRRLPRGQRDLELEVALP
jgi:hypothetical protein